MAYHASACKRTIDRAYDNIDVYLNELVMGMGRR